MLNDTTRQLLAAGGQDLYVQCRRCGVTFDVPMVFGKPRTPRARYENGELVHVAVVKPCNGRLRVVGGDR